MNEGKTRIYFVSDGHFGRDAESCEREEKFVTFLDSIKNKCEKLFILGDLFEFWIEYKYLVPKGHEALLTKLKEIIRAGTEVHYIVGNHDFALGSYISNEIGMKIHWKPFEITLQKKRCFIAHGDGMWKKDLGYRMLKPILRCRFNQFLYKLLPADLGIGLARFCSGASRVHTRKRVWKRVVKAYRGIADEILSAGKDIVILGHTHYPEDVRSQNGAYINVGGWLSESPYAVMENGEIQLKYYEGTQTVMKPV